MTETTPAPQSPPEPWSGLFAGYALGDLTPTEIELVDRYLTTHPDRRSEVASLISSLDLLLLTLPVDCPSPALKQQIV